MKRGAVIGIVGGIVAVAAVVAVGVWWSASRTPSAGEAADRYLRALESGDYAAIESMFAQPPDDTVAAAFSSAESYVSDAGVKELATAEGEADVRAEAEIGGERRSLSFTLTSTDGGWLVTPDSLALVRVETTFGEAGAGGDSVWIGDALIPTGTDVAVLPAVYVVEAAPRALLSGSATAAVSSDGSVQEVAIETALTPEATTVAQERLDAYLDECAAPATAVPVACGIRVPWAADLTGLDGIAFRIEERPVLALSADGSGFEATGGVIVATATGSSRTGGTGSFTYRADDWALRGSVEFTGDAMVLSVR